MATARLLAPAPDGLSVVAAVGPALRVVSLRGEGAVSACADEHSDVVRSVAFTPDAKHAASIGDDKRVCFWECGAQWRCLRKTTLKKRPSAVCFLPDGDLAVGDRFGDVLILDPATLAPRPREFGHLAHVTELLVLPASGGGGPLLVSADTEGKVRVSRAQQLYVVEHFLLEHFAFVSSVAALRGPGGEQLLVSGGGDGFVRVWDPRSGREIARACLDPRQQDKAKLRGGIVDFAARFDVGDVVTRVAVDPRTQLVAVAVHPQPRVLLFALRGDELRAHGEILLQGTPSDIAFASDGRLLVAADGAPLTFFAREGDGWRRVEDAAAAAAAAALAALPARGGAFAAEQQARLRELYQKRLRFEERRRRNAKRPKGGEDGAATAAAAAAAPAAAGEAMDESKDGEEEAEEEEEEEEEGEEREGEEEEAEEDGEEDT